MSRGFFVTGTDTGVGKTMVACALLYAFARQGQSVVGMKPVTAGCEETLEGLRNGDVEQLIAASTIEAPRHMVNPYALKPRIAPHIAAQQAGIEINLSVIKAAFDQLKKMAGVVVVEGVGGFKVPLNNQQDSADLAELIGLPVILVVGMRLGCLNHALLTSGAIEERGLKLAGWVANCIDPHMAALRENLRALEERLVRPALGVLAFQPDPQPKRIARELAIQSLV
ncbi:MAG TPA: dethiobiotin synthase [Burkholderiales bacterium]|nr:dethiobiotin synthase [Burkholderiales bacterium]